MFQKKDITDTLICLSFFLHFLYNITIPNINVIIPNPININCQGAKYVLIIEKTENTKKKSTKDNGIFLKNCNTKLAIARAPNGKHNIIKANNLLLNNPDNVIGTNTIDTLKIVVKG